MEIDALVEEPQAAVDLAVIPHENNERIVPHAEAFHLVEHDPDRVVYNLHLESVTEDVVADKLGIVSAPVAAVNAVDVWLAGKRPEIVVDNPTVTFGEFDAGGKLTGALPGRVLRPLGTESAE